MTFQYGYHSLHGSGPALHPRQGFTSGNHRDSSNRAQCIGQAAHLNGQEKDGLRLALSFIAQATNCWGYNFRGHICRGCVDRHASL